MHKVQGFWVKCVHEYEVYVGHEGVNHCEFEGIECFCEFVSVCVDTERACGGQGAPSCGDNLCL